jgi:DNA-directed RNA polymerase specialized sigma24 family protein
MSSQPDLYGGPVDIDAALELLAPAYAAAIRLDDAGVDEAEIARTLHTEPEAVPSLLQIGRAKLAAVLAGGSAAL